MLCYGDKKKWEGGEESRISFWDFYPWGVPAGLWDGIYLVFLGFLYCIFAFFFLTRWNCWIKFLSLLFLWDSFLGVLPLSCLSSLT